MNSFRKVTLNEFENPGCLNGIQELLEKSFVSYETISATKQSVMV
mgnify:CR=1 FL=1